MNIDATFWVAISFFIFVGLIFYFKIPEKVKFVSGFSVKAIPKATAGKQYIAHAVKPQ